jgi:CheY-like chemotaxis protein
MTAKEILVVDDEPLTLNILTKMLTGLGYSVTGAMNGMEALELFESKNFLVVLTDIGMPLIDGNELISRLNRREMKPVIIVQTGHNDLAQVIDTMRRGVFDYIIKPVEMSDIAFKLERAFSIAEIMKNSYIVQKERVIRLEQQLQWLQWNEGIIKRDYDRIDQALFKNLHTSFNQGAGFGTLLTLIQLISSSATEQGDGFVIDKALFQAIQESAKISLNTINTFSEINSIITRGSTRREYHL